jgi:hypothetical protein
MIEESPCPGLMLVYTDTHETPRFGNPEFMEDLRTVVGVDPLPDTPQLGACTATLRP